MKYKAIEKVPPIRGKINSVLEAGAAVKILQHKKILIIDVWQKGDWVMRRVCTKTDFADYDPKKRVWSQKMLSCREGELRFRWRMIDMSDPDMETVRGYLPTHPKCVWSWVDMVEGFESDVRDRRLQLVYQKRKKSLESREKEIPDVPKSFAVWVKDVLFADSDFLYYKRHRFFADLFCSACGTESTIRIRPGIGQAAMLQHVYDAPKNMEIGACPVCGKKSMYRPIGRMKGTYDDQRPCYLIQPYKVTGVVVRYFMADKLYWTDEKSRFLLQETVRDFITEQGSHLDYHKHDCWTGKEFWDDCNLYGLANITRKPGSIAPQSSLKGTMFEHCGLEEYVRDEEKQGKKINPGNYLEKYREHPEMEYYAKLGLYKLIEELVDGYRADFVRIDRTAKRPADLLMIRGERLGKLRELHGSVYALQLFQMERRIGKAIPDRILELILKAEPKVDDLELALKYTSATRIVNYVMKHSGRTNFSVFEEMSSQDSCALMNGIGYYLDYFRMRVENGYHIDEIYIFPRDLKAAHDQMLEERQGKEQDRHREQKNKQFPEIEENFDRLDQLLSYRDEKWCIRPAASAGEIVDEGRILHHCVGGDNYLRGHAKGESWICFLRDVANPAIPWITVEFDGTKVRQWFAAHDTKPHDKKDEIDAWLEQWAAVVRGREEENIGQAM